MTVVEILNRLNDKIEEINRKLEDVYGKNSEWSYLPYGTSKLFDEEDTGIESYCQEFGQDLKTAPHDIMRSLDHWTNTRAIYPLEWVKQLIVEAYEEGKKGV